MRKLTLGCKRVSPRKKKSLLRGDGNFSFFKNVIFGPYIFMMVSPNVGGHVSNLVFFWVLIIFLKVSLITRGPPREMVLCSKCVPSEKSCQTETSIYFCHCKPK